MAKPAKRIKRGETWAVDRLRPNPNNSNTHTDEQIDALAAAIKARGFTRAVLIDEEGLILAGHGGYLAARRLSMPEVPVDIAIGWTDADKEAHLVADNALGRRSKWDDALLSAAVDRLEEMGGDRLALGLSSTDLKRLQADSEDELVVHEVETSTVRDEFWISIRGPLQHQAETLRKMREATAEMGGVSVTLGTIGRD